MSNTKASRTKEVQEESDESNEDSEEEKKSEKEEAGDERMEKHPLFIDTKGGYTVG